MNTQLLDKVHADQLKKRPDIQIGDNVKLHMRISEGDKSRVQVFQGLVISMKGRGLDATITVRKISSGVGVERIVPLHSPTLEKIEVVKRGKVRRSKLYFMRDRVGKRAMKIAGSTFVDESMNELDEASTEEVGETKEEVVTEDTDKEPKEQAKEEVKIEKDTNESEK